MIRALAALLALLLVGAACSADRAAACGDGVAEAAEGCDGADLRGRTCAGLGFNHGDLACLPACVLDLGACATVELCGNGRDDDGNGDKDCDDVACRLEPACGGCAAGAAHPIRVELDAHGLATHRGAICAAGDVGVYTLAVPAGQTGTLVAETSGFAPGASCYPDTDTRVTLRDATGRTVAVDDDGGEGSCSRARAAGLPPGSVEVEVGASPFAPGATFGYRLSLALTIDPCGDGLVQAGQECDDGNGDGGDGCSAACRLEPRAEVEPDDTPATAVGPFPAPLATEGTVTPSEATGFDRDFWAFDLAAPGRLRIETFIEDAPGCDRLHAAPELRDAAGTTLLGEASFTDLSPTSCGRLVTGPLAAGRYLVLVEARPAPARYRLVVAGATP